MQKGRNEIEELARKIQALADANQGLKSEIQELRSENQELRSDNKKLRERIDYLIRQLFGRKSEKLDPRQLLLMLGLDETPPEEGEEPENDPPPSEPPRPKRKRRQLRDRLPEDLPVRTVYVDPPEVNAAPENYVCIGEETHSELSMTPPVYFIRKTVRRKYVRKDDRRQPPVIVPAAPRLIENSFASPELLTDIVLKKYTEHLPLYRQAQTLKRRFGIELSRKTMCGWMWHMGNWLRPIYEEIKAEIRAGGYIQADETCIKYIDPGSGGAQSGYLFTYHGPGKGVVFEWHRGRGAKHLESMLGGYSGDLQCDGYSAYRTFNMARKESERYRLYACWSHARRKFFDAKDELDAAAQILRLIQALYRIESELREARASHEERKRRRRESRKILGSIKPLLDRGLTEYRPQSLTGKAIFYTVNVWEELLRYAETGHIEIDNNLVENAIRPTAIGKKNWLFFGSPDSGRQSAIIFSVLETCRTLGVDQQAYLWDILSKLPSLTIQEARRLTPARWLAERRSTAA